VDQGSWAPVAHLIAAVVAPYVASATHCWQLYTWQMNGPSRTRVAGFIAVLVAGSVLVSALRLRFFPYTETSTAMNPATRVRLGPFICQVYSCQQWVAEATYGATTAAIKMSNGSPRTLVHQSERSKSMLER